jgi:hypothetical protein
MKKTAPTWYANIWIAGDANLATHACLKFCQEGLCVIVTPTLYVYTGGSEAGVCVRMINYPRFPMDEVLLRVKAERLAEHLKAELCQGSYSIEFPDETVFFSTRPQDAPMLQP